MTDEVAAPGPQTSVDPALEARLGYLGASIRWLALAYAAMALLGQVVPFLAEIPPGPSAVRDLTPAAGLGLFVLALAALLAGNSHRVLEGVTWRRLGLILSGLAAAFGGYVMVIFLADVRDLWCCPEAVLPSFSVGIILLVLGVAVPLSVSRIESRVLGGQIGALLIFSLTGVIVLGYLHGDPSVGRLFLRSQISVQATVSGLFIAMGVFLFRPASGVLSVASSPGAGGRLLRRLGPIVLLMPAALLFVVEGVSVSDRVDALAFVSVGLGLFLLVVMGVVVRAIDETAIEAATAAATAERARIGLQQEAPVVSQLSEILHLVDVAETDGWEVATRYRPGVGSVAGDASAVRTLPDGSIGAALVDMTGHGAEPAIRALGVRDLLLHSLALGHSPAEAMSQIEWNAPSDTLASAIAMRVTTDSGEVELCSAGHPPAIRVAAQLAELIGPTGPLLYLDPAGKFETHTFSLAPGDAIVFFSDGVADVQRLIDGKTDPEIIADLLVSEGGMAARTADLVLGYADGEPTDDQSVVVVRRDL